MVRSSHGINLYKPRTYDALPEQMFEKVRELNAKKPVSWSVARWDRNSEPESELAVAALPMIEAIRTAVPDVEGVNISAFTNRVSPGEAQISNGGPWHWDGPVRYMMAADNLPTQVLYIPESVPEETGTEAAETLHAAQYGNYNFEQSMIENGIKMGMFAVAQSVRCGMIDMDGMVHRSVANPAAMPVDRVFLRAEVVRSHRLSLLSS